MNKNVLFLCVVAVLLVGCSSINKFEVTKELMGTEVTITVYDEDKEKASFAVEAAFKEIERLDNLLSSYKNISGVSLLNQQSFIENPSDELMENVKKAIYYGNLSDGAFDITVQPILSLYTHSFSELKRAPNEEEIDQALKFVDYRNVFLKDKLILFGSLV